MSARSQSESDPIQVECVVSYTGATVSVTVTHHQMFSSSGAGDRLPSPHTSSISISSSHHPLNDSSVGNGSGDLRELLRLSSSRAGPSAGGGVNSASAVASGLNTSNGVGYPPLTVKDLAVAVCRQLFGFSSNSSTTINIVAGSSNNSLKDDVPLQPLLDQELFLFFDPRLLPKVQTDMPTNDQQLSTLIRRQRDAVKMMNTPLRTYFERLQQETDFLLAEHKTVEESLTSLSKRLPSYMDKLRKIRLIEDESKSLADLVNHGEKRLKQSCEWLEKTTQSLPARRKSVDGAKESLDELLRVQSNLMTNTLRVSVDELQEISRGLQKLNLDKHQSAKAYMRVVSEFREAVEKDRQGLKLIKQGLLNWLNMDMLKELPSAYEAAVQLAMKRLVFYTAVKRVNSTLAYEAVELQAEVDTFVKEWGTRFPQNVLPELTAPVSAGRLPRDNLAVLLEQSVVDLDEDPASDLLARLGLAGTGQPQSARGGRPPSPSATKKGKEEKEKISSQIAALSAELEKVMAEKVHLEDDVTRMKAKVDQAGREMVQVATEFATKEEGYRSVIQALQDQDQRGFASTPLTAAAPRARGPGASPLMKNAHLPHVASTATIVSDFGYFDDADHAVVNAGVCNRSFRFMRFGKTFIANATYGTNSVGVTMVIEDFVVAKLGYLISPSALAGAGSGGNHYVEEGDFVRCDVVEVSENLPPKMGRCRIVKVIVTPSAKEKVGAAAVAPSSNPASPQRKTKAPVLPDNSEDFNDDDGDDDN